MTDIFISDLHLSESRMDVMEGFLRFLREDLDGVDNLYILGDFFEVWVGDDHQTSFNQQVIDALAQVDLPIYIMHGNRDFLLGEVFCSAIGATLLADPTVVRLGGEPVLLMHGDSLCTEDTQYMQVRGLLRSEAFQVDFLSKSIPERVAFAQNARQESQAHTQNHTEDPESEIMDVTPSEVVKVMKQYGVKRLIHGHTHRPKVHQVDLEDGLGQRIVLGDWDKKGWKVCADEQGIELLAFNLESQ